MLDQKPTNKMLETKQFKVTLIPVMAGLQCVAATVISAAPFAETFSGDSSPLVGGTTKDGNIWSGDPEGKIKQNGTQMGSWSIYHPVTITVGKVYSFEGDFTWTNTAENSGFGLAFATADSGPGTSGNTWSEGKHIYGSTFRSGSSYMFGFAGPASNNPLGETLKPSQKTSSGILKVVLNTINPAKYSVQIFDTAGNANGPATAIGTPKITHILVSSGSNGSVKSLRLTESSTAPENNVAQSDNTTTSENSAPLSKSETVPKGTAPPSKIVSEDKPTKTKKPTPPIHPAPTLISIGDLSLILRDNE